MSRVLQLPSVASATHRLKAERSRRPAMKCTLVPSALHQAMSWATCGPPVGPCLGICGPWAELSLLDTLAAVWDTQEGSCSQPDLNGRWGLERTGEPSASCSSPKMAVVSIGTIRPLSISMTSREAGGTGSPGSEYL